MIETFGWLAFKDWFREPEFWSWWNCAVSSYLCDEPIAHSCEILPYVLLVQMKFFVHYKRTLINSIVLFGFQGFTNVPLYKLMQHRPKVASPDLQEMSDQ